MNGSLSCEAGGNWGKREREIGKEMGGAGVF
jgi:hypothetical protein